LVSAQLDLQRETLRFSALSEDDTVRVKSLPEVEASLTQGSDTVPVRSLPEVEVVAPSRVSTTKQTAPLQIIDRKSIERLGIKELAEAVRLFAGVAVKDYGGLGGLKTVSIRSLGAQHTAVGYDGVTITDAQSGQVDISRFTLDNVEVVSLSTGVSDDIFQTARLYASAGTLHIKTQKPRFDGEKSYYLSAKLKSGSFGLLNPVLAYSRKLHNPLERLCLCRLYASGRRISVFVGQRHD